jgi:hypothetical protein
LIANGSAAAAGAARCGLAAGGGADGFGLGGAGGAADLEGAAAMTNVVAQPPHWTFLPICFSFTW